MHNTEIIITIHNKLANVATKKIQDKTMNFIIIAISNFLLVNPQTMSNSYDSDQPHKINKDIFSTKIFSPKNYLLI
jgi:hypothetical protein